MSTPYAANTYTLRLRVVRDSEVICISAAAVAVKLKMEKEGQGNLLNVILPPWPPGTGYPAAAPYHGSPAGSRSGAGFWRCAVQTPLISRRGS